jgi:hypothetical protein
MRKIPTKDPDKEADVTLVLGNTQSGQGDLYANSEWCTGHSGPTQFVELLPTMSGLQAGQRNGRHSP